MDNVNGVKFNSKWMYTDHNTSCISCKCSCFKMTCLGSITQIL